MNEPILTDEDHELWKTWQRAALVWARTRGHARKVEHAVKVARQARVHTEGRMAVMWSGGKDSTVMTHLVCVEAGLDVPVVSEKDDLDFPGEEDYIVRLAESWGLDLEIVRPEGSIKQWVAENCDVIDNLRGRGDELSRRFFYPVVEAVNERYGGVYLGLRADESRHRLRNLRINGHIYTKKNGITVCMPLATWTGMDVMAYMAAREIEPLPMYRCIALDHRDEPWRLRKSWWLPGEHTLSGGVAWLRRYYPSLYHQICSWWPHGSMWG